MALPKRIDCVQSSNLNVETGGLIAAMSRPTDGPWLSGQALLPEWTAYADALSPTEDAVRTLSRMAGIAALAIGVIATSAAFVSLV